MTIILCYGKTTAILWELVRHLHSLPRCAVSFVPADHILLILMETALQAVTDSPGETACSNYDTLNHHNDHCFHHCCTDRKDSGMAQFPYKVYRILLGNDSLYVPKSKQLWCCHVFQMTKYCPAISGHHFHPNGCLQHLKRTEGSDCDAENII